MTQTGIDVDQVVREVLARLGLAPAQVPLAACEPGPQEDKGQLIVTQRVVSLAALNGGLNGIRQLVVPPRAIVTPSVRDELRRRQITLVFGPPAAAAKADDGRLVLMAAGSLDLASLAAAIAAEGLTVDVQRSDCLMAAIDRLASQLAQEKTVGVLATDDTAAGLCLANRLSGVRAVLGVSTATIAVEASSVGANLLVASPAVLGPAQLKQLVVQFCRQASHECPQVFRKRLS
jgi:ribose 5-phosphate isomerase RpiB